MKRTKTIGILTALAMSAVLMMPRAVQAKAAYNSSYTQEIPMSTLIAPVLQKNSDPTGVAQMISQWFRYGTITKEDLWVLYQSGAKIPAKTLGILSSEGLIPGFWYKMAAGLPFADADFAGVYDPDYYVSHNPAVKKALDDGTLKREELLANFIAVGMPAGLRGSEDFDPAAFERDNPDLAKSLGDKSNWYLYYLIVEQG